MHDERRFGNVRECGLAEEGTGEQENGLGAYSDKGDERCKESGGYGEECDLRKKARRTNMITEVRSHLRRRAKRTERTMLGLGPGPRVGSGMCVL